jgi:hypothetical protein
MHAFAQSVKDNDINDLTKVKFALLFVTMLVLLSHNVTFCEEPLHSSPTGHDMKQNLARLGATCAFFRKKV